MRIVFSANPRARVVRARNIMSRPVLDSPQRYHFVFPRQALGLIKLLPRLTSFIGESLSYFDVMVASDVINPNQSSDKQLCAHVDGPVPQGGWIGVKCDPPISGRLSKLNLWIHDITNNQWLFVISFYFFRIVSIQLDSTPAVLTLCEVKVFANIHA